MTGGKAAKRVVFKRNFRHRLQAVRERFVVPAGRKSGERNAAFSLRFVFEE